MAADEPETQADESDVQADPGDAVNTDLTSAVGAEDLDEDRIGADPLESGMDPPERWAASDRYGVTAGEQQQGETLDQRLTEERPDFGEPDFDGGTDEAHETRGPTDDTASDEASEPEPAPRDEVTTVELPDNAFEGAADEPARDVVDSPSDVGRAADVAGGSVAESEREPDDEASGEVTDEAVDE